MARRIYDPLLETCTSVDILYLMGLGVIFVTFNSISAGVVYFIYPVLVWSIYQDWRSARVAQFRQHWYFLISDLLTVLNYIALSTALALPGHPKLGYSERIWLHWGLVFVIYIVWNIVMSYMPDTDDKSRKFFLKYSLIESPIVIYCLLLFFEAKTGFILLSTGSNILSHPAALLIVMGLVHTSILFYWVYQTYTTKEEQT